MIERVTIWHRGRSVREQRMLLIMAALFLLIFSWLLVVRPLGDALSDARARHGAAIVARAQAQAQVEALRALRTAGGRGLTEPVETVVARTANEAGFRLSRTQAEPGGRGVSIAIEAARPQALFTWIASLERQGVVVASLSTNANADRTVAVQATLRGRAS
ncbi:MAG TPA: type II secretion system protein GspM [Allosphingosinicella sp.]|nr:type II secretion system protein GspM [Allosphingosinicella sp.]